LGHRTELAHQTAGNIDPGGPGEVASHIRQIESRSVAIAAFFGPSGFGGMVGASQLASADVAADARRDPLWPELSANLLPRRSAGVRQPHCDARHLERACDADSAECRWHHGADRSRKATELDQYQAQAAISNRQHAPE